MVESAGQCKETRRDAGGSQSLGQEGPLKEETATHSSILAGKSHGQRSLSGYSPWGRRESGTTEHTSIFGGSVDKGHASGEWLTPGLLKARWSLKLKLDKVICIFCFVWRSSMTVEAVCHYT